MDIIFIEALRVDTVIGVFDWEKEFEQPLYFDVEMQTNILAAAESDNINQTVSYKDVSDFIIDWCEQHQYDLLESLAEAICQALLNLFAGIQQITLKVKKPHAVPKASSVGIQICRQRKS